MVNQEELVAEYLEAKEMVDTFITRIVSPNCIVVLVDKVGDDYAAIYSGVKQATVRGPDGNPVKIVVPETHKARHQTGVGVATILKKWEPSDDEEDTTDYDRRALWLHAGDRIVFNPGTPISQAVFPNQRIQIVHLQNVLFMSHPLIDAEEPSPSNLTNA